MISEKKKKKRTKTFSTRKDIDKEGSNFLKYFNLWI